MTLKQLRTGSLLITVLVLGLFPVRGQSIDRFPIQGEHRYRDNFGTSRDGGRRSHRGIDIFARRGTPVVSASAGVVTRVTTHGAAGRAIFVRGDGLELRYFHLDSFARGIRPGTRVAAGQLLGAVGNTGNARNTPAHLHFEIRNLRGVALNPYEALVRAARSRRSHSLAASR